LKTIVYYYSLTGNCEKIGKMIAFRLECECEQIIEKKKRLSKGFLKFLNGGAALKNEISEIKPLKNDPGQFEQIVVVTPFWAASPTPAVRGFIEQYKKELNGKFLGLAMMNLGTDPAEAFEKYQELFPEKLTTISFTKAKEQWTEPKLSELVIQFITKLKTETGA
jgi:flavodoxin